MEVKGPVLIIDFNNMVHRARSGFKAGDNSITYTFFLILRKNVEIFSPSQIYIVKEGRPQARHDAMTEYKATRVSAGDDFWRQHGEILDILSTMPVKVVRHPLREADDTIAHIANVLHANEKCVVISTDTDFIQLLKQDDDRITLWNPTKKACVEPFSCDYVKWKSLVGDGSDNIAGFKGIGPKTAHKLLENPNRLEEFLSVGDNKEKWERNQFMISFHPINDELEYSQSTPDWEMTHSKFSELGIKSIVSCKTWTKYVNTFRFCLI